MKIEIERNRMKNTFDIWAKVENFGREENLTFDSEQKNLVATVIEHSCDNRLKPLLSIPRNLFIDLSEAMANYGQENKLFEEPENLLKGKLIATEIHLQDSIKARAEIVELFKLIGKAKE